MAVLGVSDVELARRLGVSRQAAHARRTGRTAMTAADLLEVADALDIDPALFLGPPSDAVRWIGEHRSELLDALESPGGRQGEPGQITHRQRAFPCKRPVFTRRSPHLTFGLHLPHSCPPPIIGARGCTPPHIHS